MDLCPTKTEQNCGHTQSRRHYEASMKIVHGRRGNCGYAFKSGILLILH